MQTFLLSAFMLLTSLAPFIAHGKDIHVIGEHLLPYQGKINNNIDGLAVDITRALINHTKSQAKFEIYPWARAYADAQRFPNTLLLSVSRTPEREQKFNWVGQVAKSKITYWRLKERTDIKAPIALDQLQRLRIGVQRNAMYHEYLKNNLTTTKNLALTTTNAQAIKMLFAGRVDIMMGNEDTFKLRAIELGLDASKLEKVAKEGNLYSTLYLAFSPQTADETVAEFKHAYQQLSDSGELNSIRTKWFSRTR